MSYEEHGGVYVMHVASMLTGMHPQTLRKYERAGFLVPSRHYKVRMYSDEDIARLKLIKHLVIDEKLNLAGVELVLRLRDKFLDMKSEVISARIDPRLEQLFTELIDDVLEVLENY
jgi:MerR family transcriptional regulator/heat shock protein HspR